MKVLVLGNSSFLQRRALAGLTKAGLTEIDLASRSHPAEAPWSHGRVFDDYAAALADSRAGLVYISLVNSLHGEWVERALMSGRHVLVDKPAVLSGAEARQMVSLARSRGLCLAEMLPFADHPLVTSGIELMQGNGGTTRLQATLSVPPWPADDFRRMSRLGGGAVNDIGPYAAAAARLFFSEPPSEMDAHIIARDGDVDVAFGLLARFAGGGAMTGLFGFDTEYVNEIAAFGPHARIGMTRPFTLPADVESRLQAHVGNEDRSRTVAAADSVAVFVRRLIAAIADGEAEDFHASLLADAAFLDTLRARCAGAGC